METRGSSEFYARVFRGTYTGSMHGKGQLVHALWPYILTEAYPYGIAELNPIAIAPIIGDVTPRQVADVIGFFCQPDPDSRNTDQGGARLVQIDKYRYRVVSWDKYAERASTVQRRERANVNAKNYRARKKIATTEDGEIIDSRHQSSSKVIDHKQSVSGTSDSKNKSKRKRKSESNKERDHSVGGFAKRGSEVNSKVNSEKFNDPTAFDIDP